MTCDDLIDDYMAYLRETDHTDETIRTYRRTLIVANRELPFGLERANENELKAWVWREGLKPSSRANYLCAITGFFAWAVDHADILTLDPTRRIKTPRVPPRLPRVAASEDVARIMRQAADPYLLWAKLAAYQNARCVEIFRLHREHITKRHTTIHRGKGDKPRVVPTHPTVWAAVADLPPGPLVTGYDHQNEVSRDFIDYLRRKLDLHGVSLHRLRGWWATMGYRRTKDLVAIQRGMGHSKPSVTAGYIDVSDTELQTVIDGLPVFGPDVAETPEEGC